MLTVVLYSPSLAISTTSNTHATAEHRSKTNRETSTSAGSLESEYGGRAMNGTDGQRLVESRVAAAGIRPGR